MNKKMLSALRMFTVFYQRAENNPVALADIRHSAGLSVSYAEQLFKKFREAGLVLSARGPGGGYTLAREDITVTDVLRAIKCLPAHPLYDPIVIALNNVTIKQLAEQKSLPVLPQE